MFFENTANNTAMYSEHFQKLKRSWLQEKFPVATSLTRYTRFFYEELVYKQLFSILKND